MQRILPRGEIESLDRTRTPRMRLPQRARVFADRAARMQALAQSSRVGGYLALMARVAEAQQRALNELVLPQPDMELLARAKAHAMPPLSAASTARDPVWRTVLAQLVADVTAAEHTPPETVEVCSSLGRTLETSPHAIDHLADALLAGTSQRIDLAAAPFVMAALQVYWTGMAAGFEPDDVPGGAFGVCPLCGSAPVASVVRVGGAYDGHRYLCCPLCASEAHLVRVTCSYCSQTQGIAYHAIDGDSAAIKAESCDRCRRYRKIFYQEKDPNVEPVADDLASVLLDVLMGEAGYQRGTGNPLLWQDGEP